MPPLLLAWLDWAGQSASLSSIVARGGPACLSTYVGSLEATAPDTPSLGETQSDLVGVVCLAGSVWFGLVGPMRWSVAQVARDKQS